MQIFEIKEELNCTHVKDNSNQAYKHGIYELWTRSRLNQTHINKIHGMNNKTYQLIEKKNKRKNETKYLLAWAYSSME